MAGLDGDLLVKMAIAAIAAFVVYKLVTVNACASVMYVSPSHVSTFVEGFDGPVDVPGVQRVPMQAANGVASSLLPGRDDAGISGFGEFAPNVLEGHSFLDPEAFIGLSSISGTLKNPNLSIRQEPHNPVEVVSPWLQSTIKPDPYRNGLTTDTR